MTNKPTIKDCMEQAQIFASTWGRVGNGVFGTTMGHATAEKEELEAMLRAALDAPAQAQEDARDAARYRFLRDTGLERYIVLQLGLMWDDKIDAAIAAQQGGA